MMQQIMKPQPTLFGPSGRELFGVLHPASGAPGWLSAVLLCSAFGQEAILAHRTFKVLADRLARKGHATLRFDYYGTGDSDGDDADVVMSGLCADIEAADSFLRASAPDRPLTWLGLGLGASAAWRAAASATRPPDRLFLWDPILEGRDYLDELRRRHLKYLGDAFKWTRSLSDAAAAEAIEVIGFTISERFGAEISAMTSGTFPRLPPTVEVTVVTAPGKHPRNPAMEGARLVELDHGMDWMADEVGSGSLVPSNALHRLVALIGGGG